MKFVDERIRRLGTPFSLRRAESVGASTPTSSNSRTPTPSMEHYRLNIHRGRQPCFDEAPPEFRRAAFGVDYLMIRGLQGGEFYFTRPGWAVAHSILPRVWFDNERFRHIGKPLLKATGSVYLMPIAHPARSGMGMVVKFCRFGQSVGCTQFEPGMLPPQVAPLLFGAEFLGPFEELGQLARLRAYRRPDGSRIRTKIPLGIYCPPTHYAPWQLGRDPSGFWRYDYALRTEQAGIPAERRIVHHWERLYILLYQWIEGIDLEEAGRNSLLPEDEVRAFTVQVGRDLCEAGFAVLDHKARHIIVRPDLETGRLLQHRGRVMHALIDYELLVPVPAEIRASISASPRFG